MLTTAKHLDRNFSLFCFYLLLCWLGARDGIVELRKNGTPHRKMTLPEDLQNMPTEFSSLILFLEVVGPCSLHLGDFTEPRSLSHARPSPWSPSGLNNQARHYVFLQPSNSQFACHESVMSWWLNQSTVCFFQRGQLWTSCSDSDELCLWHCKDLTKPFLRVQLQNCTGVNCMIKVKNQVRK